MLLQEGPHGLVWDLTLKDRQTGSDIDSCVEERVWEGLLGGGALYDIWSAKWVIVSFNVCILHVKRSTGEKCLAYRYVLHQPLIVNCRRDTKTKQKCHTENSSEGQGCAHGRKWMEKGTGNDLVILQEKKSSGRRTGLILAAGPWMTVKSWMFSW